MLSKPNLIRHPNVPTLTIQKYERYLPTAFDESLTILEKLNKMIHEMYLLGKVTNEMIDRWNEVIEWVTGDGLNHSVIKILNEWLDEGLIHNILQQLLHYDYNVLYFGAKGDGKTNDSQAVQTATKILSEMGGGTLKFPNGHYTINVDEFELYSNVKWFLNDGAVLDVTNTLLRARATGKGYGSGVTNFSIEGGTIRGNFAKVANGTAKASKFLMHHAQFLKFRNVLFYEMAVGHVFDFCGCSDIVIDSCTFQGRFIPSSDPDLDYKECIQIDHSSVASMGFSDEIQFTDGLPTCNVVVRDCQFVPIKKGNDIQYFAPTPMGNHSQFPRAPHNIVFRNNYMESVNGVFASDWTEKFSGWIHFSTVRDLIIENNVFNNVAGQRASVFTCRDRTMHLGTESEPTTDYEQIGNIIFRDNEIRGFNQQGQVGMSGLVSVKGWYGYKEIENIHITGNRFIDCGRLRQWKIDDKAIDCIELVQVKTALVDGNYFYNVDRPIYTGPPTNNPEWVGETSLKFTNNYIDEVGYNTANILHLGGLLIVEDNTLKNISGSFRIVGNKGKVVIQDNKADTSDTRNLRSVVGVSDNFKDKIFSLSGDGRVYYISNNIGMCDVDKWQYLINFSTPTKVTVNKNNNYSECVNEDNLG